MNNITNNFRAPSFDKGIDPKDWINMYETWVAISNISTEKQLRMIPGFFNDQYARKWFFNQDFKT
jgi:hypothetical protein